MVSGLPNRCTLRPSELDRAVLVTVRNAERRHSRAQRDAKRRYMRAFAPQPGEVRQLEPTRQ
jgi:hypothetical protein